MYRAALFTLLLTSAAYADDAVLPAGFTTQESTIGQTVRYSDPTQYSSGKLERSLGLRVLADFRGMTIYTFDGDKAPGKSACAEDCLTVWQPLLAPLLAVPQGDWSVIRRDDGSPQWAYKGHALYTFVKDVKAGDAKGDGLNGPLGHQWHAARP